jgi:hypothetical protein
MLKLILFLVRKPGLSPAEMRMHYETVHIPLIRKIFPQIVEHRRNYPDEGGAFFPPGVVVPHWDVIAEMWVNDRAGLQAMLARQGDPAAGAELVADEATFLDRDKCGMMIVDEAIGAGARMPS